MKISCCAYRQDDASPLSISLKLSIFEIAINHDLALRFLVTIAQGLFPCSRLFYLKDTGTAVARKAHHCNADDLVFTNLGYAGGAYGPAAICIHNCLVQPFGMMLLFGPGSFSIPNLSLTSPLNGKKTYWLHSFLTCYSLESMPLCFFMNKETWEVFIHLFLTRHLLIRDSEKIIYALQDVQLFIYLLLTFSGYKVRKEVMEMLPTSFLFPPGLMAPGIILVHGAVPGHRFFTLYFYPREWKV
jgi:hypothetical protein